MAHTNEQPRCTDCYEPIPKEELITSPSIAPEIPGAPYHQTCYDKMRTAFANDVKRRSEKLANEAQDEHPLLTRARSHYIAKETPMGNQLAAEWLLHTRQIITDRTERLYAYSEEHGHYRKEGETLLKSDLAKAFHAGANKARVAEVIAKCKALSYRDTEDLERTTPPHFIPVQNGVYDMEINKLRPHSPLFFFTYKHPVTYDPKAECPQILAFLDSITDDQKDKEILLDMVSLCLYRERVTRNFYILIGEGHNGKGALIRIIRNLLGRERVVSITPQALSEDVFAPAQLQDKNANIGGDIGNSTLADTSLIKSITGGDAVSVQRKGVDREEKEIYAEFIWSSNTPPRIVEDTLAIWDRLVSIKFPYTFVDKPEKPNERLTDPDIEQRLNTPQELSGLLNVCLKRIPGLVTKRRLSVRIDPQESRREYRVLSDTVAVFIDEACEEVEYDPGDHLVPPSGYVTCEEAYRSYKNWCKDQSVLPVTANKFGRVLRSLGSFDVGKVTQVRAYLGLKLKEPLGPIGPIHPILPAHKVKGKDRIGEIGANGPTGLAVFTDSPTPEKTVMDLRAEFQANPGNALTFSSLSAIGFAEEVITKGTEMLKRTGDIYELQPDTWRYLG